MDVKGIVIEKTGGPSVMKWKTVNVPKPKKGQVTVRHTAIGFNFIDQFTAEYKPICSWSIPSISDHMQNRVDAVGFGNIHQGIHMV